MDINILTEAKEQLRMDISIAIDSFVQETGYTPHSIDVKMIEVTDIRSNRKEYAIGGIHILIDI